jgi:myosin-5
MADGGNDKLLLDAVPLDDSGEYEIPDPRPLEQLETYVPSCIPLLLRRSDDIGLQVPNIRFLAQLVASDTSFKAGGAVVNTPSKSVIPSTIPEAIPTAES